MVKVRCRYGGTGSNRSFDCTEPAIPISQAELRRKVESPMAMSSLLSPLKSATVAMARWSPPDWYKVGVLKVPSALPSITLTVLCRTFQLRHAIVCNHQVRIPICIEVTDANAGCMIATRWWVCSLLKSSISTTKQNPYPTGRAVGGSSAFVPQQPNRVCRRD